MSWTEIDVMSLKAEGIGIEEEHYAEIDENDLGDEEHIEYIIEDPEGKIYEEQELMVGGNPGPSTTTQPAATATKPRYKRITPEQQERILELQGSGKTVIQIATEMSLRRTTVHEVLKRTNQMVKSNILKLRRMQKKTRKQKKGKRKELLTDEQVDLVHQWLEENSSLSMSVLVDRLREECDVIVSKSYIAKIIDDFTYSVSRLHIDTQSTIKQDNKLVTARQGYARLFLDLHKDYSEQQFVFVHFAEYTLVARTIGEVANERSAKRSMYNAVGCALNKDKVLMYNYQFLAMDINDYCDFYARLIERLLREEGLDRAVIVLDEQVLGEAKEEVLRSIRDAGYQHLSLPRDSLFLNPVERLFSGWNKVSRRANAKDEKSVVKALETAGETLITEGDCQHCYTSAVSTMLHCYHGKWYPEGTSLMSFTPVKG